MKKLPFAVAISAALLLAACGKEAPQASAPAAEAPKVEAPAAEAPKVEAPAAAAAPAAEAPKAEATASVDGKSIYGKTCAMCHAAGVAGAPKPGDKEAWGPRIAQGNDTMYKHALEGFTGDHGMMPARGGNPKLTDEEVKAAVDFMVGQSV
ncbi:c-type cytochrome [Comamonas nitrativorans]|uniref:C-type cytochrome n=1 Tax=Comamonas nitrativorans TaxID=108437 RepID=A0ABV9H1P1_9BURK